MLRRVKLVVQHPSAVPKDGEPGSMTGRPLRLYADGKRKQEHPSLNFPVKRLTRSYVILRQPFQAFLTSSTMDTPRWVADVYRQ